MGKMLSKYLTSGIKLTNAISDDAGTVLFSSGHEITKKDIDYLIENQINTVNVEADDLLKFRSQSKMSAESRSINALEYSNPLLEDLPSTVSRETQKAAIGAVHSTLKNINNGQPVKLAQTQEAVDSIVLEIFDNTSSIINLLNSVDLDSYIFSHSLNVCVLSILTAMELGVDKEMIKKIGIVALLHDIGNTKIDQGILNKKGKLTEV